MGGVEKEGGDYVLHKAPKGIIIILVTKKWLTSILKAPSLLLLGVVGRTGGSTSIAFLTTRTDYVTRQGGHILPWWRHTAQFPREAVSRGSFLL